MEKESEKMKNEAKIAAQVKASLETNVSEMQRRIETLKSEVILRLI